MFRIQDRFMNALGEVIPASPKRDKYGKIEGFYSAATSLQYDVIRWIRRDHYSGIPREIAACVPHEFEQV